MLHSAAHWRPLLNGYSGGFPRSYAVNRAGLGRVLDDPAAAWRVLADSGATHAIVHEDVFLKGDGARVSAWLASHGAREVAAFGADRLFDCLRRGLRGFARPFTECRTPLHTTAVFGQNLRGPRFLAPGPAVIASSA